MGWCAAACCVLLATCRIQHSMPWPNEQQPCCTKEHICLSGARLWPAACDCRQVLRQLCATPSLAPRHRGRVLESCEDVASHLQRGIKELPSTKALDRLLVEGKGGCCQPCLLVVLCIRVTGQQRWRGGAACGAASCCMAAGDAGQCLQQLLRSPAPAKHAPRCNAGAAAAAHTPAGGALRVQSEKPVIVILGSGWAAHSIMKVRPAGLV